MRYSCLIGLGVGSLLLAVACSCVPPCFAAGKRAYPDPKRFEKRITAFEAKDEKTPPPAGAILCTGSSSMVGWHGTIEKDLAPLTVIPRGFGGSTMHDVLHYADRVVIPYRPRAILVYEGDNDIACGIEPEKARDTYAAFAGKIAKALPGTRIYFIAAKPSIRRWKMWPRMKALNNLVKEMCVGNKMLTFIDVAPAMLDDTGTPRKDIFKADNLHMNRQGYTLWTEVVKPVLMENESKFEKAD